jgi:hypothetical protein
MKFSRTAFLVCGPIPLGVIAHAAPRVQSSLTIYFQSTLKDQAHQQKTFKKVGAAWKPPSSSRYPDPLPGSFPYPSYEAHFHMSYLAAAR